MMMATGKTTQLMQKSSVNEESNLGLANVEQMLHL